MKTLVARKPTAPLALLLLPLLTFVSFAEESGDWREMDRILARIVPPSFPARDFVITEYGAVADGHTDAKPAIDRAVSACAEAGGGRVVIPAGRFFCDGPIHLRSDTELHVTVGAVLKFGAEPDRYLPLVLTRYEGTLLYGHSPRIYVRGATNVAITGRGTIDGNGRATLDLRPPRGTAGDLRQMGAEGVPVAKRIFGADRWMRPSMIQFFECTNVLIEDVQILDSTFWIVHPVLCTNVTVRRLTIESMNANNDGVDPDSCRDVLIEDCEFRTGDDAIAIKSGRDQDGWEVGRPSENIVIRRCVMGSRHSGVCIGSEMSGGVRRVFVEDCSVNSVSSAFYFKANLDRGGLVEHVRVRRIHADQVREGFVRFETGYHGYRGGNFPPSFRDFVLEDLNCHEATAYAFYIEGVADAPIRDVVIRRASVAKAQAAYWFRHLEDVHFEDVRVGGEPMPASPPLTPVTEQKLEISR